MATGRPKKIIMDRAPQGDSLSMQATLGFTPGASYDDLANAFNLELGTQVTGAELQNLATVQDVCDYLGVE